MELKKIKLENIRSYIHQEIDFPVGTVLLSGNVGAGKSTVLLAIEFALFGLTRGILSGESLLRNGAEKGFVELHFNIGNREIIIRRALKKGLTITQDSGYIIIDDVKQNATAVELKQKILDLLNYPKEMLTKKSIVYRYTIYTPQEEMKHILLGDADLRLDTLRKVFGIDKYKKIKENSKIIISTFKEKISGLNGMIADLEIKNKEKEEYENKIKDVKEKLSLFLTDLKKAENEVDTEKNILKGIEDQLLKLNELKKDFELKEFDLKNKIEQKENTVKEIVDVENQLKILNEEIRGVEDIEEKLKGEKEKILLLGNKEKNAEEKNNKLNNLKNEFELTNLKLKVKENELEKNKNELEQKSKEILELLKEDLNLEELNKKQENIKKIENEIKTLSLVLNELKLKKEKSEEIKKNLLVSENCPLCKQALTEEHKNQIIKKENENVNNCLTLFKEKHGDLESKEKEFNEIKSGIEELKNKKNKLEIIRVRIKELEDTKKTIAQAIDVLSTDIEELTTYKKELLKEIYLLADTKKELEELRKELDLRKSECNKLEIIKLKIKNYNEKILYNKKLAEFHKGLGNKIFNLENEKNELIKKIEQFKKINEEYELHKKRLEDLQIKQKGIEIEAVSMEKELEWNNEIIQILSKEIEEKMRNKGSLAKIIGLKTWIEEVFISLMDEMERRTMMAAYTDFNSLFKKWFYMLMDNENLNVDIDNTFTPVIVQAGHDLGYLNLSGGEKTAVALAYRLALNQTINNMMSEIKTNDLLILDEPTDGFSDEQLDRMKDVINELAIKQIIIVSHETKIESFVDHVIRFEKQNNVSRVI